MKTVLTKIRAAFVFFLIAGTLSAQNFNDALRLSEPGLGSSARALAMGNSFTAVSNDYSAVFFNPAGLGLINDASLSMGLNYENLENSASLFGSTTKNSIGATNFSRIGLVFPFPTYRGSLVFAFGYNQNKSFNRTLKFDGYNSGNNSYIQYLTSFNDDIPYLLGLSYPVYDNNDNYISDETVINGNLNQSGTINEEGNINSWNISASAEVAKNLFVGGTLNLITGSYKRYKDFYEDDDLNIYNSSILLDPNDEVTRDFQTFYLNDVIDWDISGWDFKLGFLYKLNPFINIGGAVKFPSYYTIKEKFFVSGSSTFAFGDGYDLDPEESKSEYDINSPYEFSGGASVNISGLIVSADIKLIDYSQMEFSAGLDPGQRYDNNKEIISLFDNVLNYSLGAEYSIPMLGIKVRGGYMSSQSPYKGDPSDFDKKYFTAGLGLATDKAVSIDIAYAHGWWKNFSDNYDFNVSRTFQDISVDKLIFNVAYNF
ncbi:MAG: hypothetical protein KJ571_13885 [Bacteroidetes bacterium]|nr:hypothetical protein [Bacteroidota bacterium]